MSQGIRESLAYLEDQLEAITPKTDINHGFVCYRAGSGFVPPIEQRPNSNRFFELSIRDYPVDDGAAGLSGRRRSVIDCRVRYDIPDDLIDRQRIISEDAEKILTTLKGPTYSLATTGIVSIIPEQPTVEALDLEESAHLLTVPFTLLFLES
jgi:hypothetical protein